MLRATVDRAVGRVRTSVAEGGVRALSSPVRYAAVMPSSPSDASSPASLPTEPARVLGFFDATCIVVGAIVGVGIFFNPSGVAKLTESGTLALAAWGLAGLIALCGGLTFAALGTKYNASGAQYELLRDAYGPMPAFLFVFCNATAIQGGAIGVIALVCARNVADLMGVLGEDKADRKSVV